MGLRRLGRNVTATLIRQMASVVLSLGLSLLLARSLGPEGNGQYTLLVLLPTLLSSLANFGIAPANVYFVGRGTVTVTTALRATLRLWALISSVSVGLGAIVIVAYGSAIMPGVPIRLLIVALAVFPVTLLESLVISFFQARQDFGRYNRVTLVSPVCTLLLAGIAILALDLGVAGGFAAYGLGHAIGLVVAIIAVRTHKKASSQESSETVGAYARQCVAYGWKAHLSNVLTFVNYRADVFLVNLLINPAATGIYIIAVQLCERLWMLSKSVSTVLLPRLAQLHSAGDQGPRLAILVARWVLFISLAASLILAAVAGPLIELLFGRAYSAAAGAVLVLLPGVVLGSLSRVLANDLAAQGRPEINMYLSVLVMLVNIVGNVVLIPSLGLIGAAMATTIAYSLNAVAKVYVHSRLVGHSWQHAVLPNREDWAVLVRGYVRLRRMAQPS